MIWFCSDLHINHDKNFIWERRGFSSIQDMNEQLVKIWNSYITNDDIVYFLGDVAMGFINEALPYLTQLQGEIHFIIGNHDNTIRIQKMEEMGWINEGYATVIKDGKRSFYLSHYPTIVTNMGEERKKLIYNLYGHTHQSDSIYYNDNPYMINVGIDVWRRPVSIDEIQDIIRGQHE